jgi:Na+/melibiose symporter-like transporter
LFTFVFIFNSTISFCLLVTSLFIIHIPVSSGSNGGATHNGEALVGFHEDALSQAAVGKAQLLLALVLGLGLAADCSELTILGYILPAAELQLCIDEHKKGWLVSITLLALAGGSLAWGILGDHLGRRRALISALSVAALFSAVATVMPTYGTFMTARSASRQPSRHVCNYELL